MHFKYLNGELVPNIYATGCLYPIQLKDIEFPVRCGKCEKCKAKRRSDWSFRLGEELKHASSAYFITMTYNDFNVPLINEQQTLYPKDCQNYIKRLRNAQIKFTLNKLKCSTRNEAQKLAPKISYYTVGEYGTETKRPHYHMLLFNLIPDIKEQIIDQWKNTYTNESLGHVYIGTVTMQSILYTAKYMMKDFNKKSEVQPPFSYMSKNPPIGYSYLEDNALYHIDQETLTVRNIEGNTSNATILQRQIMA